MGHQTSPLEAAPAYDHIFSRPTNTHPPPSGSSSGYTTIPQNEPDIELAHGHSTSVDSLKPHQHCETCDALTTAREVRANERSCCLWVAIVLLAAIVAAMLLGMVALVAEYKHRSG
ncbi:hypothetical protein B5807_00161 [Epicoccum nigrum]|uniref:Uncharacterized protein n=1 Tax=Epicoccum nigrum TaxID=105696 RepID=A0A1Y2MC30_EPING|nr:hypothetical protein B5807_00161 [Epicoccum nigrum]